MTRKIAICGVFDIKNYGDLLFPVVAERRLQDHETMVTSYAPSSMPPGLGVNPPKPIAKLMTAAESADGVIVVRAGIRIIYHDR